MGITGAVDLPKKQVPPLSPSIMDKTMLGHSPHQDDWDKDLSMSGISKHLTGPSWTPHVCRSRSRWGSLGGGPARLELWASRRSCST